MESLHTKFGAPWDHEPREQTSARQRFGVRQSSAALGPARWVESARGLAQSKTWRFMESLHAKFGAHWDHEPPGRGTGPTQCRPRALTRRFMERGKVAERDAKM